MVHIRWSWPLEQGVTKHFRYLHWRNCTLFQAILGVGKLPYISLTSIQLISRWGFLHFRYRSKCLVTLLFFWSFSAMGPPGAKHHQFGCCTFFCWVTCVFSRSIKDASKSKQQMVIPKLILPMLQGSISTKQNLAHITSWRLPAEVMIQTCSKVYLKYLQNINKSTIQISPPRKVVATHLPSLKLRKTKVGRWISF